MERRNSYQHLCRIHGKRLFIETGLGLKLGNIAFGFKSVLILVLREEFVSPQLRSFFFLLVHGKLPGYWDSILYSELFIWGLCKQFAECKKNTIFI